ncbi:hypothetical protein N9L92_04440 [Saprospiraceae bacterium]|nr:hypothetical protein [Saprospiraceae bacterium]
MKWRKLLDESILLEIGDLNNIEPYPFGSPSRTTLFKTDVGDIVLVDISKVNSQDMHRVNLPDIVHDRKDVFNISFVLTKKMDEHKDDQATKTNYKYLCKVLKTVVEISKIVAIREMSNFDLPVIVLGAVDKIGQFNLTESQKIKIYQLVLDRNLPRHYRRGPITLDGIIGMYFTKNK